MPLPPGAAAELLIIGGGLAAGWLARALHRRGLEVVLVSPRDSHIASFCGYGGVPWWLPEPESAGGGPVIGRAPALWQALEAEQGRLGWQTCELSLHWSAAQERQAAAVADRYQGLVSGSRRHSGRLTLPYARVDGVRLAQAWPRLLERCCVDWIEAQAVALEPGPAGGWRVLLEGGGSCVARQVVLAAGAGSLALWPPLRDEDPPLAMSWAAALLVAGRDLPSALLPEGAGCQGAERGIVMPLLLQRPALEARAGQLERPEWIVDAGLAPHGDDWLLGQLSLVAPAGGPSRTGAAGSSAPPAPAWLESRLRSALASTWPQLAALPGRLLHLPVAFRNAARPWPGPVAGAPGLWSFCGFNGAFAMVPELAERLAEQLIMATCQTARPMKRSTKFEWP